MCETTKRSPLLPDRHEPDFFVCDIFDAVPKSDTASMEHPVFTLSTKPDMKPKEYAAGDGSWFIKIAPSQKGIATVFDRDVLIYCISQIMAGINQGRKVSRVVRFKAFDFLKATNRLTSGEGYAALKAALTRLQGTQITTDIKTGGAEQFAVFGLIDRGYAVRKERDGRMSEIEITLSDWVFNAIEGKEVLTLHRDYFRLRKPLERRIYEIARKHCGKQGRTWRIGMKALRDKTGSGSKLIEFRRLVGAIVEAHKAHQHIPDYDFEIADDQLVVTPRAAFVGGRGDASGNLFATALLVSPDALDEARRIAPRMDVHSLEADWKAWAAGQPVPKDADKAFLGFVRKQARRKAA